MLREFENVWAIDFEYRERDGELPEPWCGVGHNLRTGEWRTWRHDDEISRPVYTAGPRDLVVAYAAEAEGKCVRRLGWPLPTHSLDLLPLFRAHCNVFGKVPRAGLLDALAQFGLPGMATAEKDSFRQIAIRGTPFTSNEMNDLVEYCREDVLATGHLLNRIWDKVGLANGLLMARYTMRAVSAMQTTGIPINVPLLDKIVGRQDHIRRSLVREVDTQYGVYEGSVFRKDLFLRCLASQNIAWPSTPSGQPKLDDDTFKNQAQIHPQLAGLHELRKTLATLHDFRLPVGADGRNRTSLMPFATRTGRNQPGTSRFIFSLPKWMRHLIQPPPGKALVMLDYEQEEFLIGAVLSKDSNMTGAYESGDPYLASAVLAGAAPAGATKESHPQVRARYKTAVLGLQYGCGVQTLGANLRDHALARQLVAAHHRVYRRYHEWTVQQVDRILLGGILTTPFGWTVRGVSSSEPPNTRSIANWPVQAAGADILRIAAISLVEHGFEVAAPVHDAILLIADANDADEVAAAAAGLMRAASAVVLGGMPCRVEWKITRPDEGYCGEPAPAMFRRVQEILIRSNAR